MWDEASDQRGWGRYLLLNSMWSSPHSSVTFIRLWRAQPEVKGITRHYTSFLGDSSSNMALLIPIYLSILLISHQHHKPS